VKALVLFCSITTVDSCFGLSGAALASANYARPQELPRHGHGHLVARGDKHGDMMEILVSICRSMLGLCCSHRLKLNEPSIQWRVTASIHGVVVAM
jgi:hypothetical protein